LGVCAVEIYLGLAIASGRFIFVDAYPQHWIYDWVNIPAIQTLTHHTSTVLVAIVLSWLVGLAVHHFLHEGIVKKVIFWIEELILFALLLYFAYELFGYFTSE